MTTLTAQQLHVVPAIAMHALTQSVAPMKSVSPGKPVQTMAAHQNVCLMRTVLLTNGATPLRVSASQAAEQMMAAQQSHAVHVWTTNALTQSAALMMIVLLGTALMMEHVRESAMTTLTAQQLHVVPAIAMHALTQSVAPMMIVLMVTAVRMAHVRESVTRTLTANSSNQWSAVCVRTSSAQILSAALMMIVLLALSAKTTPVSKKGNVMQSAHVKVQMRSVLSTMTTIIPFVSGAT